MLLELSFLQSLYYVITSTALLWVLKVFSRKWSVFLVLETIITKKGLNIGRTGSNSVIQYYREVWLLDLFKCWIASHPQNMCVVRREGFWVLDDFPSVLCFAGWTKITLNPVLFTSSLMLSGGTFHVWKLNLGIMVWFFRALEQMFCFKLPLF